MDSCVIDNVSHGITWYLTVVRGDMWGPCGDHLGVAGVLTQSNPRTKKRLYRWVCHSSCAARILFTNHGWLVLPTVCGIIARILCGWPGLYDYRWLRGTTYKESHEMIRGKLHPCGWSALIFPNLSSLQRDENMWAMQHACSTKIGLEVRPLIIQELRKQLLSPAGNQPWQAGTFSN